LLVLFELLRQDVDATFKRYECEMHRVIQAENGSTAGDEGLARSVTYPPINGEMVRSSWATRNGLQGLSGVFNAKRDSGIPGTSLEASCKGTNPAKCKRLAEANAGGQTRAKTPEIVGRQTSAKTLETRGSVKTFETLCSQKTIGASESIRRWKRSSKKVSDEIYIDHTVRDVLEMNEKADLFGRICRFKLDARPLVSEDSRMHKMVASWKYQNLRVILILMDAFFIIITLQHMSVKVSLDHDVKEEAAFRFISMVLCAFFWLDGTAALALEFPHFDLSVGRTGYRFLNLIAVVQHTLGLVGVFACPNQWHTSIFRTEVSRFVFLRLLRAMLVLPGLVSAVSRQQLGELHLMIRALTGAVRPLMWCALMFVIIVMIFGAYFTEDAILCVAHMVVDTPPTANQQLLIDNWGTLSRSALSLFLAMLGGADWGELYHSLEELGYFSKATFIGFILFTYIALLNTVTAVFIKCAFIRFEHDREFIVQQELDEKREYLHDVKQIFSEIDDDMNGFIDNKEFTDKIQSPDVAAYFHKLGVDTNEVEKLFVLMDEDGSGTISKEEFMWGCLRLKGTAKSLDLEILHQDVRFAISAILEIHSATKSLKDNQPLVTFNNGLMNA